MICQTCNGFIGEPGKSYGYAGKWCYCIFPPPKVSREGMQLPEYPPDSAVPKFVYDALATELAALREELDRTDRLTIASLIKKRDALTAENERLKAEAELHVLSKQADRAEIERLRMQLHDSDMDVRATDDWLKLQAMCKRLAEALEDCRNHGWSKDEDKALAEYEKLEGG